MKTEKTKADIEKQSKMNEVANDEEATTAPEPDSEEERQQEYAQHEPDTLAKRNRRNDGPR